MFPRVCHCLSFSPFLFLHNVSLPYLYFPLQTFNHTVYCVECPFINSLSALLYFQLVPSGFAARLSILDLSSLLSHLGYYFLNICVCFFKKYYFVWVYLHITEEERINVNVLQHISLKNKVTEYLGNKFFWTLVYLKMFALCHYIW